MNRRGFLQALATVTLATFVNILPRFGGEDEPEYIPEKKGYGWTVMNVGPIHGLSRSIYPYVIPPGGLTQTVKYES